MKPNKYGLLTKKQLDIVLKCLDYATCKGTFLTYEEEKALETIEETLNNQSLA